MFESKAHFETDVELAIATIKAGKMVIMVDEVDRENEGDLVFAAEFSTPQHINFMVKEARGLVCLTLEPQFIQRLNLPMMGDSTKTKPNQSTAFTVSIEARDGVTTGISAADRSHTIKVAIDDQTNPDDIVVPGHIFPLRAREGGVLERAGHTEGSVDIAKLAGLKGAAVICEIMNDDGTMARLPDLSAFSEKHNIPIVAISDLIKYRLNRESLVKVIQRGRCETSEGTFDSVLFYNVISRQKHLALTKGSDFSNHVVDVRVHNQRPLADALCRDSSYVGFRLKYGLKLLREAERGVFLYLMSDDHDALIEQDFTWLDPERGAVSFNQDARALVKMDERMLGTGSQILRELGVKKMRIHTTSRRNFVGLSAYGLDIVESQIMDLPEG